MLSHARLLPYTESGESTELHPYLWIISKVLTLGARRSREAAILIDAYVQDSSSLTFL